MPLRSNRLLERAFRAGLFSRSTWLPTSLGSSLAAWYRADAGCYTDAAMHLALASNQYASRASETALQTGDIDFTIAGWVYLDTTPADIMYIASKGLSGSATLEYRLMWDPGAGNFIFDSWAADIGGRDRATASTFGAAPTGTWCFIVAWRDKTAGKVRIQVNNGTVDEAAIAVTPAAGTGPMEIGRDAYSSANPWDGSIGRLGFWKRTLTVGERTSLYNAGAGKFYADLTTAEKVSLVEYWNLCESSSTRVGSHAGFNLTPTNGPTVAAGPGEGLCVNGAPCKRWEDQSGNARHLTQSDITKQPLWIASGQNGLPVVRGDDTNDYLRVAFTLAQPTDVYFAGRVQTVTDNHAVMDGASANGLNVRLGTGPDKMRTYAGNFGPTTAPADLTVFHAYRFLFSGAASIASHDANADGTGDAGTDPADGITLCAYGNGSTPTDAEFGELFVATAAVAVPASPKAYLKSRWGTA